MAKRTVLVVDDSSTIQKIIERELLQENYEVITAKSGMEALAILEWTENLPDIITLDIDMPNLNGFEVCKYIRAGAEKGDKRYQRIAQIPIIFISAGDSLDNREQGYELGVVDFISKPFPRGKILGTIRSILDADEHFAEMTALIVDDSPIVCQIVRNILNRHSLNIHEVSSGEEGLAFIKEKKDEIDIVITDYLMPGISGAELCRSIRQMPSMKQVPIFFISSISQKNTILGFFHAGANDYLPKPFLEEEFRARILPHLRNRLYLKKMQTLNTQLKYTAEHDALTGLYNRGYFQRESSAAFAHAQIANMHLGFILLDLDFFKKINDTLGHAFGDLVLKRFAEILKNTCRASEIPARFGGEEFVVLLPGADSRESLKRAEEIRQATQASTFTDGTTKVQVTISSGVASYREHLPENSDQFWVMADQALYAAKEKGRNRVEEYRPEYSS